MKVKKEKMLILRIIVGLQTKRIEDWFRKNGLFNLSTANDDHNRVDREQKHVIEMIEETDFVDTELETIEHDSKSIFDYMNEELKEQYKQDVTRVCELFYNQLFMKAYLSGDNDMMLKVIELFYEEGRLDYELLCELINAKLVTLSEENIEHFKQIGLIPTFNNSNSGLKIS